GPIKTDGKAASLWPDPGRRARHALLAIEPPESRQAGAARGGRIDTDPGHCGAAQSADSARAAVGADQFPLARRDRAATAWSSQAADPGRAGAAQYSAGDRPRGAHSAIDRQRVGDGRVPVGPRDHEAAALSAVRARGVRGCGARADRGTWYWAAASGY